MAATGEGFWTMNAHLTDFRKTEETNQELSNLFLINQMFEGWASVAMAVKKIECVRM